MRWGMRTVAVWVILTGVLTWLTVRALQQWDLASQWLLFYVATVGAPAGWTVFSMRTLRRVETSDPRLRWRLEWMAWAPLIAGGMALSSALTLIVLTAGRH